MGSALNCRLKPVALAAVALGASLSPCAVAAESARPLLADTQPMITEPAALYVKICLWSEQRAAVCRDVRLTPGAAGPVFASLQACRDGQQEALRRWHAEAGPVFGFTAMEGDGYRIEGTHCRLASTIHDPG